MMPASVNARVTRATCSTVTPLFMSAEQAIGGDLEPAAHRDAARARRAARHSSGVNVFSNRMLPHQVMTTPRAISRSASARRPAGGAASSTKWNPVCPVSAIDRLDAIDEQVGREPDRSARCSRG